MNRSWQLQRGLIYAPESFNSEFTPEKWWERKTILSSWVPVTFQGRAVKLQGGIPFYQVLCSSFSRRMFLFPSTKYTPHLKTIRASSPGSCCFQQAPYQIFPSPSKKKSVQLHPWKLRWPWEVPSFNRKYSFIHGGFSIVMLVFGWVAVCLSEPSLKASRTSWFVTSKRIWKKTNQKSSWHCFWCWVSETSDGNHLCWVSQTYCFLIETTPGIGDVKIYALGVS